MLLKSIDRNVERPTTERTLEDLEPGSALPTVPLCVLRVGKGRSARFMPTRVGPMLHVEMPKVSPKRKRLATVIAPGHHLDSSRRGARRPERGKLVGRSSNPDRDGETFGGMTFPHVRIQFTNAGSFVITQSTVKLVLRRSHGLTHVSVRFVPTEDGCATPAATE